MVKWEEVENWRMKFEKCSHLRAKYGEGAYNYRKGHNWVCYSPRHNWGRRKCVVTCSIAREQDWLGKIMAAKGDTAQDIVRIANVKAKMRKYVKLVEAGKPVEAAIVETRTELRLGELDEEIIAREIAGQIIKTPELGLELLGKEEEKKNIKTPISGSLITEKAKEISVGMLLVVVGVVIALYMLIRRKGGRK